MSTDVAPEISVEPQFQTIYDLEREQVYQLTGDFLRQPDMPQGRRFVGAVVEWNDAISNAARWLEARTFEGAFKHTPTEMAEMYGSVERDSRFLVVFDRKEQLPVGVIRVVRNESAYNMTLAEARQPQYVGASLDEIIKYHDFRLTDKAWDVATMGIDEHYRGKMLGRGVHQVSVSGMLQRMFVKLGYQEGIVNVLAMLDDRAYRSLSAVGVPFMPLLGRDRSFRYKNSPATYAVFGSFEDFRPAVIARHEALLKHSLVHEILRRGIPKALKRRGLAKVAGMAALGLGGVDQGIKMPASSD